MNNTHFRRLLLDTPAASKSNGVDGASASSRGAATPALGSRLRSSIPMTPRSIAGNSNNDFARQLAERNAELNPSNVKKFRSSAAPKGTKLRAGFQDRTQLRTSGEEDDKTIRVKALEDMVKLGQMDHGTFEALRDQIIGGDVKDVHLVKGLDYKLLERVRRGEDVLSDRQKPPSPKEEDVDLQKEPEVNVDEEFDKLEGKDVQPVQKEERAKRGEMAPPPLAGKKRTRDDILRELKASRLAAAEKAQRSALGPRFVKVGPKRETSRIEKDERGREILITVDENGKVKRKVKKARIEDSPSDHGLLMPDKNAKPLGMDVAPVAEPAFEEDGDIFEGIGTDYNPLGDIVDNDDESEDDEKDLKAPIPDDSPKPSEAPTPLPENSTKAFPPTSSIERKNWLNGPTEADGDVKAARHNRLDDPMILAALKKASTLKPMAEESSNEEEGVKVARRKRMLESHDRDAEDMDMEFGSSRFGDQEDEEDARVKLSVWGGEDGEEGERGKGKGKGLRKRGGKKRKGDGNSAADVLKVMERRKAEGK